MGKDNLFGNIIIGTFLGVPLLLYGGIAYEATIGLRNRFETAYETALIRYADTDHNNVISPAEKEAFDAGLLREQGMILLPDEEQPRYSSTGEEVPLRTLIDLVEDYLPGDR
ncbi:MAG TPA: hypothetical protein VJC21_01005 [Candidatus Nanoarchaeia archaeon]|nr:hypothetical protein [Candidatus Nanoarchaeia archaeon]